MVKKLEFADTVYYCRLVFNLREAGKIDSRTDSMCIRNPYPDCRKCQIREVFPKLIKDGEVG